MSVHYHKFIFFAYHGSGPYKCMLCNKEIKAPFAFEAPKPNSKWSLHVHHVDGDSTNNKPKNLVSMHNGCHARLHLRGKQLDPEWKKNVVAAVKRRWSNPKYKARVRAKQRLAHRTKRSEKIWNSNFAPAFIAFEGIDRAGKTEILRAFAQETLQAVPCVDRCLTSCRVYDRFFNRYQEDDEREVYFDNFEATMSTFGYVVVYVNTPVRICLERGAQYSKKELEQHRRFFREELRAMKKRHPEIRIFIIRGTGDSTTNARLLWSKMINGKEWKRL